MLGTFQKIKYFTAHRLKFRTAKQLRLKTLKEFFSLCKEKYWFPQLVLQLCGIFFFKCVPHKTFTLKLSLLTHKIQLNHKLAIKYISQPSCIYISLFINCFFNTKYISQQNCIYVIFNYTSYIFILIECGI